MHWQPRDVLDDSIHDCVLGLEWDCSKGSAQRVHPFGISFAVAILCIGEKVEVFSIYLFCDAVRCHGARSDEPGMLGKGDGWPVACCVLFSKYVRNVYLLVSTFDRFAGSTMVLSESFVV